MITIVTTCNLEIFKMFYEHKYHGMFKEKLYLYVDKDDSSEFRKIVDPKKTRVFDKNNFKKFYGDRYLNSLTTFSKIYFLNMLFRMNFLDHSDSFYFTDDDVLFFNNSFEEVVKSDKAVYSKDMILIIDRVYPSWKNLYSWISKNFDSKNNLCTCATNFYFPKSMVNDLAREFVKTFDEMIEILYKDRNYIEKINEKSKSTRNAAFATFYLDTPFFNVVFPKLGIENYSCSNIYLTAYSHFRKLKESLKTQDTSKILEKYFSKVSSYPKKQPLFHFSVNNKLPLMRDCFNYLNEKEYVCKDIDDILKENPREEKKIIKSKVKSLF